MVYLGRKSIVLSALLITLTLSSGISHAQTILTEDTIHEFIAKTTHITSGQDIDSTESDIKAYLERHLDPKSRFRSTIVFKIPGFDSQKQSMALNKKDFIDFTLKGSQSIGHYEKTVEVKKVRISKDGQRASIETSGFENGVMPVPTENGSQDVPVEGSSTCKQILKLSERGVIQMFNANCKTEIQFSQF